MKRFLVIVFMLICTGIYAQQDIAVVNLKILPVQPTKCDSVYLVTQTQTFSSSHLLEFTYSEAFDTSFSITRCYRLGPGTSEPLYYDTIPIGYLEYGYYHITYGAHATGNNDCINSGITVADTLDFYVSDTCHNLISGIEDIASDDLIKVFPNPTSAQIQFSENANAQLYSITGQLVAEKQNVSMLDMSALASGIYTLTLLNKRGEVQRSKVVKE